jgi:COMPASS component SWD3
MGSRTMAVCGAEPELRIFDVETKKRTHFLDGKGGYDERGHSNRVFCVKFYKDDPNMLISGGWDNRIVF